MNINEVKYSPIGLVQVEEVESGKIVYETHNMIVEHGRNRIIHKLFPADGNDSDDYTVGNLYKFYESNHRNLTVPNMRIVNGVSDPSIECSKNDIIYDGETENDVTYNLSEIELTMTSYDASTYTDGRQLYRRTKTGGANMDTLCTNNKYNPSNGDSPLTPNDCLVIKFNDSYSGTNRVIHICCDANSRVESTGKAITAVGLLFFKTPGNTMMLFSRAAIDPIFMRPGRHYIMHYTLSF